MNLIDHHHSQKCLHYHSAWQTQPWHLHSDSLQSVSSSLIFASKCSSYRSRCWMPNLPSNWTCSSSACFRHEPCCHYPGSCTIGVPLYQTCTGARRPRSCSGCCDCWWSAMRRSCGCASRGLRHARWLVSICYRCRGHWRLVNGQSGAIYGDYYIECEWLNQF